MVFNEWFGDLTDAQWRAYRRHNISPSDHDSWTETGWDGDTIAAWVNTLGNLDGAPNCLYGPGWAAAWKQAGFTAVATFDVVSSIAASTGRRSFDVRPSDAHLAVLERQPSLFEQDSTPGSGTASIRVS